MTTAVSGRVPDPDALRAAGLRPIRVRMPESGRARFAEEYRRRWAISYVPSALHA